MEITNTSNMTAEQIADTLNKKGYTYCGESARAWEGNAQARIYFGRDFVTVHKNGTITNHRAGKPRALTIGDEAIEAIYNIMTPATPEAEPENMEEPLEEIITTTTQQGTEVIITITPGSAKAELTLPQFGRITTGVTAAACKQLGNRITLLGTAPDGKPLYIPIPENIIMEIINKKIMMEDKRKEIMFPGITELEEIRKRWDEAWDKNRRAWDNIENNPKYAPINTATIEDELNAARAKYPRAAAAINAKGYAMAEHPSKAAAGKKALELLKNGGSLEEAQSILDNWLPEEAMWD